MKKRLFILVAAAAIFLSSCREPATQVKQSIWTKINNIKAEDKSKENGLEPIYIKPMGEKQIALTIKIERLYNKYKKNSDDLGKETDLLNEFKKVLNSPDCDESVRAYYIKHDCWQLRLEVAKDSRTPVSILAMGANDSVWSVSNAVGLNLWQKPADVYISPSDQERFSNCNNWLTQEGLLMKNKTDFRYFVKLCNVCRFEELIAERIKNEKSIAPEHQWVLAKCQSDLNRGAMAGRLNADTAVVRFLLNDEVNYVKNNAKNTLDYQNSIKLVK